MTVTKHDKFCNIYVKTRLKRTYMLQTHTYTQKTQMNAVKRENGFKSSVSMSGFQLGPAPKVAVH
jgi:hypothetical protein